jgi:hypothetical protein
VKKLAHRDRYRLERVYRAWCAMKARCSAAYWLRSAYFDRGIRVCPEWSGCGGYGVFFAHVGQPPTHKHTIDRIDNDRGYEPGNVRWATKKQQCRNKRNSKFITVDGITRNYVEWAQIAGVTRQCIRMRIDAGWTPEEAVRKGVQSPWLHRNSYRTKK